MSTRAARATLRDKAYLDLRRMLMLGGFPAGTALPVRKLCEELDAGTMPVRDAVQRLAAEGALEALPNGRLRVPLLGGSEIEELFALRLLIESHAAARAAETATPSAMAALDAALTALEAFALPDAVDSAQLAANLAFHFAIYRMPGSPQLVQIIENLWLRFGPLLNGFMAASDGAQTYRAEQSVLHRRLVEAIRMRDPEFARSAMKAIIERSRLAAQDIGML
jgi:DNA-binding GntR family transcriptional regulator